MKCPESIEELQELEKMIPLCKVTLYEQAKARIETGAAKSVSEAARQIGEETDRNPETIKRRIYEGASELCESAQLSSLTGTDKHRAKKGTGDGYKLSYSLRARKQAFKRGGDTVPGIPTFVGNDSSHRESCR